MQMKKPRAKEYSFTYPLTLRPRTINLNFLLSRKQIQSLFDRALKDLVHSLPEGVRSATLIQIAKLKFLRFMNFIHL